jgi:predicted acyl esterase
MGQRRCGLRKGAVLVVLALVVVAGGCRSGRSGGGSGSDDEELERLLRGTEAAPWDVSVGVEQITVTGASPGDPLTLYGPGRRERLTLLADERGQAHFAYLPGEPTTLQSGPGLDFADLDATHGTTVEPGRYAIVDESAEPRVATDVLVVPGRDDHPDPAFYEGQTLTGARLDVLGNVAPGSSLEEGFQYLEMRDGVRLSVMVRFPDGGLYGDGPWPTVIEYSGYGPSNPASEEPAIRLARALGYATVAVNMRGTGCSGGVFDVFNAAQAADGYDAVEIVAAQDWVAGGRVGMVGVSYSGISQLYTAATAPPHLAAVTPQSVIADPWLQAWPGGIYNSGFTQQWIRERNASAAPGGQSWSQRRIDAGDAVCAAHQPLRDQNPDFDSLTRSLTSYTAPAAARDLRELVRDIEVPVFITGAFQDEQTGPQFTVMLDDFDSSPLVRTRLWNGRHPDGLAPANVMRWYEFLELYVAERVPVLHPVIRVALPGVLADEFGLDDVELGPDRFADLGDDVAAARARYEAERPVDVTFESGIGADEVGEPVGTFTIGLDSWPDDDAEPATWYLAGDETLAPARAAVGAEDADRPDPGTRDAPARAAVGAGDVDMFRFDPGAGASTLFGGTGDYPLLAPVWDMEWTRFEPGRELSYLTEPFTEDTVFAGPGYADLFVSADTDDVHVQVSLSEVRPDGTEYLVTNGWLDLAHRREDRRRSEGLEIVHSFTERDRRPVRPGEFVEARIDIPGFAAVFREGSRLRLSIATPGRNHATWEFENPVPAGEPPVYEVARSREMPSALVLSRLDGVDVPDAAPAPCPGLRGQACRPFVPTENPSG